MRLLKQHSVYNLPAMPTDFRTIWTTDDHFVEVIDQRLLPHQFVVVKLLTYTDAVIAIKNMTVRGAPLIGATAAYGVYLAVKEMQEKQLPSSFLQNAFMSSLRWILHLVRSWSLKLGTN